MAGDKFYNNNRIQLPEGYDPYDMDLKKQLHEKADAKNFIHKLKNTPVLACGAIRPSSKKPCTGVAGHGTDHLGYGRCRLHGGTNPGPVTPEGKAIASQNSRKHGLYAAVLGPDERKYFDQFIKDKDIGLEYEIYTMKAKILSYLEKWRKKWDDIAAKEGPEVADEKTKVLVKERGSSDSANAISYSYYHAGTIEDKPLIRALETLSRLIDKQAKLTGDTGDNLLNQVNEELRAASYGNVSISWGGQAQQRKGGGSNEAK